MPGIVFIHGLFCEQVRREAAGTDTYVGVTRSRRLFNSPPPFAIKELSAVVWVEHQWDMPETVIRLWLDVPGGEAVGAMDVHTKPGLARPGEPSRPAGRRSLTVVRSFGRLSVPLEGDLTLKAEYDGQQHVICRLGLRRPEADARKADGMNPSMTTIGPARKRGGSAPSAS